MNAGHNPPVVIRPLAGSLELRHLRSTEIPVGISPNSEFPATTFQLEVGDVLVAYTDGITEAENSEGEQWGMQRLENLLRSPACADSTPERIIECILDEVSAFSKGQRQRDDVTLIVMNVQAGCEV